MLDFNTLCPHCEEKFKLKAIGLEGKEFIQCPYCRSIIKIDLADLGKQEIRIDPDFVE
jgi:Zn-finger nucleic acid-binding protein